MNASLLLSFAAGVLTVAAPCVLPLLPVIAGGSIVRAEDDQRARWRPYTIAASLAVSIVLFTLLLKATTALLGVPPQVWQIVSGAIVIALGVDLLVPAWWESISVRLGLSWRSGAALSTSVARQSKTGDVLTGMALGPVFASCSPTYALIVAVVLPASLAQGVLYVIAYALGLTCMLLLISLAGRAMVRRLGWLANPHGWFRRTVGIMFILVGLAVITGFDKQLQTWILDAGLYAPIARLEHLIGGA